MLFDTFDATDLNKELKELMDGLSVKVGGGWGGAGLPVTVAMSCSCWLSTYSNTRCTGRDVWVGV